MAYRRRCLLCAIVAYVTIAGVAMAEKSPDAIVPEDELVATQADRATAVAKHWIAAMSSLQENGELVREELYTQGALFIDATSPTSQPLISRSLPGVSTPAETGANKFHMELLEAKSIPGQADVVHMVTRMTHTDGCTSPACALKSYRAYTRLVTTGDSIVAKATVHVYPYRDWQAKESKEVPAAINTATLAAVSLKQASAKATEAAKAYLSEYTKAYGAQNVEATRKLYATDSVDIGLGQKPAVALTRDKIVFKGNFAPNFQIDLVEVVEEGSSLHVLYNAHWVCADKGPFACSTAQQGGFSWEPCNSIFCRIHGYERLEMKDGHYVIMEDVYPLPAPAGEIPDGFHMPPKPSSR